MAESHEEEIKDIKDKHKIEKTKLEEERLIHKKEKE
jgi:hypothetical protein